MKAYIGAYPRNSKQKRIIHIRVDRYDHWNAYNTIALVAAPILRKLRSCNSGYPVQLGAEQWEQYLDQMIWSLEQCIEDDEPNVGQDDFQAYHDLVQEGLELFGIWFRNLWD